MKDIEFRDLKIMKKKVKNKDKTVNGEHERTKHEKMKEKEPANPRVSFWKLFRYASSLDWFYILIAVICTIIVGVCQTYYGVLFGYATEDFVVYMRTVRSINFTKVEELNTEEKLRSDIFRFTMKSVVLGVVTVATQYIAGVLLTHSSLNQLFKLRQSFLENTLNQDINWFDLNKTGDFATTFSENITKIEDGIGEKLGLCIYHLTVFSAGVIWSLVQSWKFTLVCLVPLPLSSVVIGSITWLSTKYSKKEMESYSRAGVIAEEVFSSIRTVVAFDGQNKETERYDKHLEEAKNNNIRRSLFNGISNGFVWFFTYSFCALSTWYGISLIIEQENLPKEEITYTSGILIAVYFNTMFASWSFNMVGPYLQIFGVACEAASKIFKVLDSEPVINAFLNKGLVRNNLKGEVIFDNVHFSYQSRPDVKVLNGLSVKINAGETVAFVGSSGCGKSTYIQLIQRFYDPTVGQITIDGNNIKDLNLAFLRNNIGVVSQEPDLFATTIAENVRYGKLSANQEDIERAAKKANIHRFIKSLPNGYETMIGENSAQLSGGQKQKIAIARALIREPTILLLDEATSALDTTSEAEVQTALDSLNGQCTTIIVAHRLTTVRNADRVFVMNEGHVVEEGSYEELINKKGIFFKLVESQAVQNHQSIEKDPEMKDLVTPDFIHDEYRKKLCEDKHNLKQNKKGIMEKENSKFKNVLKIMEMNRPECFWIVLGCATSMVIGSSLPVFSVLFGDIVSVLSVINNDDLLNATKDICLYYLVLGIVTGVAYLIQMYAFGVAGENLTLRVRKKMFTGMLKQEIGWFDRNENGVGALCSKLSSDAASIQAVSGMPIGTLLNSLCTLLLANALGFYYQWKLSLILLAFFPFIFLTIYFEQKILQGNEELQNEKLQKSASLAVEAISKIRTVASLGCEKFILSRYTEELIPYHVSSKRKSHARSFVMGLAKSMTHFAYAAGLSYGAKLLIDEDVHYGYIFKVTELVLTGSWSLGNTFAFAPNFQAGLEAADRINTFLNRQSEVKNIEDASSWNWKKMDVEYHGVHFSYPSRPEIQVLKGLDLKVPAGKTIALVGSSGCGKSTIIQLLERFYNPTAGEVSIDDVNIQIIDLQHLRANFGIVSQEPNLFDRTISENIAYGNNQRKVPMDEIIEAAKKANIHNFISSLPEGYETPLGSKGAQLSGGQKQRIAIARALVRNPKILILDEATSALDNESEKVVQEALDKAKEGRTCITIAHRLTTIQDADVIFVLDKGEVVEMGAHQELIEKQGHYYNFYKLQTNP